MRKDQGKAKIVFVEIICQESVADILSFNLNAEPSCLFNDFSNGKCGERNNTIWRDPTIGVGMYHKLNWVSGFSVWVTIFHHIPFQSESSTTAYDPVLLPSSPIFRIS